MISGMESIRDQCTGTSRVRTILRVRNAIDLMIYTSYGLLGILFIKPSFYIYKYFLQRNATLLDPISEQLDSAHYGYENNSRHNPSSCRNCKSRCDMTHNERNLI